METSLIIFLIKAHQVYGKRLKYISCNWLWKQNKLLLVETFAEEEHYFLAISKFAPDLIRKVQKK